MDRSLLGFIGLVAQPGVATLGVWLIAFSSLPRDTTMMDAPTLYGTRLSASLERQPHADGGLTFRGETRFPLEGALKSVLVAEAAEVDANGHLLLAEVQLSYAARDATLPDGLVEHVTFDEVNGCVRVVFLGGRARRRAVTADAPWVYLPVSLPSGETLSTPTSVSVARVVTRAADFVRLVSAFGPDPNLSQDQVRSSGVHEDWIVLGDDVATFREFSGGVELSTLRVAALALELRPQPPGRPLN